MKSLDLVQINFFKFLISDLGRSGCNINQLIRASNLNHFNLDDTDGYVPLIGMYRLFDNISQTIGVEDFISVFHESIKVQNLHNYGSFMLSAPDLLSAAKFSLKFASLNYTSEIDGLEVNGPVTKFWINLNDEYQSGKEHASALQLAFILDHLRLACGDKWAPMEIHYPFEKLPNIDSLLPEGHDVIIKSNQEYIAVFFPTSVLQLPVFHDSNQIIFQGVQHPFRLKTLSQQERIEQLLNSQITGHVPTLTQIAEWFGKSPRSMQRKLDGEHTSYFEIVDQWRFKQAVDFVENSSMSNNEISAYLGYQKTESFYRSFKRWTNMTPHQYKASLFN